MSMSNRLLSYFGKKKTNVCEISITLFSESDLFAHKRSRTKNKPNRSDRRSDQVFSRIRIQVTVGSGVQVVQGLGTRTFWQSRGRGNRDPERWLRLLPRRSKSGARPRSASTRGSQTCPRRLRPHQSRPVRLHHRQGNRFTGNRLGIHRPREA